MENKETHIAHAAMQQFSKFGLRKTTMQDVADAAAISRQTLYNIVPNKDALLRLVARHYFTDNLQRCRMALDAAAQAGPDLNQALEVLIAHFVIEPWHTVNAMAEAGDFEAATNAVIADEVAVAKSQKAAMIRDTIISLTKPQPLPAEQADDIASFFCATADGIKNDAETEANLHALCKTLHQSLSLLINTHANAA